LMCDLFKLSGVVIATEVHWHCGDARRAHLLIGTHARLRHGGGGYRPD
jgi:hypothetical protein